jgi:hypothetical protein
VVARVGTGCNSHPYSGVTVVLQWCYSGVTVVLQWCHNRGFNGRLAGGGARVGARGELARIHLGNNVEKCCGESKGRARKGRHNHRHHSHHHQYITIIIIIVTIIIISILEGMLHTLRWREGAAGRSLENKQFQSKTVVHTNT